MAFPYRDGEFTFDAPNSAATAWMRAFQISLGYTTSCSSGRNMRHRIWRSDLHYGSLVGHLVSVLSIPNATIHTSSFLACTRNPIYIIPTFLKEMPGLQFCRLSEIPAITHAQF